MCIVTDSLVYEKTTDTRLGEWNDHTIALLREMWADGVGTYEIGQRLGFSKSAVCGKVDRLELPERPRGTVGNAKLPPGAAEKIKAMHESGNTIREIAAAVGIGKDRVARTIGPQGPRARFIVRRHVEIFSRIPKRQPVVNLHTLDLAEGFLESMGEARNYLTHKRPALVELPAKNARRCLAVDGPRYGQVQCEGVVVNLRDSYCPDCKARFISPRAAA
jgi:hypothetical protein